MDTALPLSTFSTRCVARLRFFKNWNGQMSIKTLDFLPVYRKWAVFLSGKIYLSTLFSPSPKQLSNIVVA